MRFMLVGTGFAETHAKWIRNTRGASVDMLCYMQNEPRARELATRYGIPCITKRPFQVINDGKIDAIVIATPPDTHEALILAGIDHGIFVVTDKPLAANSRVARAIADRARITGGRVCMIFQWRHHVAFHKARDIYRSGKLGTIFHIELRFHHDFLAGPNTLWPWRHSAEEAGAGTLGDQGVHLFDLLRYITTAEWSVSASSSSIAWPVRNLQEFHVTCDTEDVADVLLRDPIGGAIARIFSTRVDIGHREIALIIQGTTGTLSISLDPESAGGYARLSLLGEQDTIEEFSHQDLNPYHSIVRHFSYENDLFPDEIASCDDGLEAQVFLEESVRLALKDSQK